MKLSRAPYSGVLFYTWRRQNAGTLLLFHSALCRILFAFKLICLSHSFSVQISTIIVFLNKIWRKKNIINNKNNNNNNHNWNWIILYYYSSIFHRWERYALYTGPYNVVHLKRKTSLPCNGTMEPVCQDSVWLVMDSILYCRILTENLFTEIPLNYYKPLASRKTYATRTLPFWRKMELKDLQRCLIELMEIIWIWMVGCEHGQT